MLLVGWFKCKYFSLLTKFFSEAADIFFPHSVDERELLLEFWNCSQGFGFAPRRFRDARILKLLSGFLTDSRVLQFCNCSQEFKGIP